MAAGYIKLYRSMLEWGWYDNINVKTVFLHLLLKANYINKEWHGTVIEKGQLITSIKNLSEELSLSEKQVRDSLSKLKKTKEISVKGASKFTLITIEKYGFYQDIAEYEGEQRADKGQTEGEQRASKGQQLKKERIEERKKIEYQLIADMYNATCVSFPVCTKLTQARKDAIKARLNMYTVEDFKHLFEIAENSDFLKGANNRNWHANFDWLIASKNMTKTLEGYYNNTLPKQNTNVSQSSKPQQQKNRFVNYEQRDWDFAELERLERERIKKRIDTTAMQRQKNKQEGRFPLLPAHKEQDARPR